MQLICLELSHWHTPVALREQFAFSEEQITDAYASLRQQDTNFRECVILSTCNRTELYLVSENDALPSTTLRSAVLTFIATIVVGDPQAIADQIEWHEGDNAVTHLCRVASGLESQVIGEPQILGQVKQAHELAVRQRASRAILKQLFQTAIRCGKRVRAETHIGRHSASVGSVAVKMAKQVLGGLADKHIVLVGSGEMGLLVTTALHSEGVAQLTVLNRTPQNAQAIAERFGVEVAGLDALDEMLRQADVVITATAAPHYIVSAETIASISPQRTTPLLLIDIAVPRNIEPHAGDVKNVTLFDMDYLRTACDHAVYARQQTVPQVTGIIEQEVARWHESLRGLAVEATIGALYQKADTIRHREIERLMRHLPEVEAEALDQIEFFSRSLTRKLLHQPTRQLRQVARQDNAEQVDQLLRQLFQLDQ